MRISRLTAKRLSKLLLADELAIVDLRDHEDWLARVADWQHNEWLIQSRPKVLGDQAGLDALTERRRILQQHLSAEPIPSTFLAVVGEEPVGSISLIQYFSPHAPERVWVTNLFVLPSFRQQGLGSKLLRSAESFALQQGIQQLYLYTSVTNDFYEQRGWALDRSVRLNNRPLNIFNKWLVPAI
jgi:GNAT superfamily N-acetyltransferase